MSRYIGGLMLMLLIPLIYGLSCTDSEPHSSASFRTFHEGYSPAFDSLLFRVSPNSRDPLKGASLAIYSKGTDRVQLPFQALNSGPVDVAWVPGKEAFVVTHGEHISLFEKEGNGQGFLGRAVRSPLGVVYGSCSWSAGGRWLAVSCVDMRDASWPRRLGVYDLQEGTFSLSDVSMKHQRPIWKNDTTLWVMGDGEIGEVVVGSGPLKFTGAVPSQEGDWFYGMFNGQALLLRNTTVCLGDRSLIQLEKMQLSRVLATKATLFVAASKDNLVAFDHHGREIAHTNPGKTIEFGSVSGDPNMVFVLADKTLMQVSIESGQLSLTDLCDFQQKTVDLPAKMQAVRGASRP